MHQNPVSSFIPAEGAIGCVLDAIPDYQPVAGLPVSAKTANYHITQFAQAFDNIKPFL